MTQVSASLFCSRYFLHCLVVFKCVHNIKRDTMFENLNATYRLRNKTVTPTFIMMLQDLNVGPRLGPTMQLNGCIMPLWLLLLGETFIVKSLKSSFSPKTVNHWSLILTTCEIFHQFSYVGFELRHKRLCYHGGLETVDSQHIDSECIPSQHGTLTKCWFNVGQRRGRWSNIKTTFGQFLGGVVSCNQFSRWYECRQIVLYRLI